MNKHISDRNSYSHIDLRCKFISMTFGKNFTIWSHDMMHIINAMEQKRLPLPVQ